MKPKRLQLKTNGMFGNWPVINYDGVDMQKLTVKVSFPDLVKKNSASFFSYTLKDDDHRPDIVARKLYGDATLDWVILYFNRIIDPMFEWPMDAIVFEKYIIDKYGSIATAQSEDLYYKLREDIEPISVSAYNALSAAAQEYWVPLEDYLGTITSYRFNSLGYQISLEGYDNLDANVKQYWSLVDAYEEEVTKNNNNKIIRVLKPSYISLFLREYRAAMNG